MLKVKFQCQRFNVKINNKMPKFLTLWTLFYYHFNNNQDQNNNNNNNNNNDNTNQNLDKRNKSYILKRPMLILYFNRQSIFFLLSVV